MTCPYCGCSDTRIVDSRKREDSVFRRRECIECGKRFNTIEIDYDLYKHYENSADCRMAMMNLYEKYT